MTNTRSPAVHLVRDPFLYVIPNSQGWQKKELLIGVKRVAFILLSGMATWGSTFWKHTTWIRWLIDLNWSGRMKCAQS